MKTLLKVHAIVGTLLSLAVSAFDTPYHGASFALGSGLMGFNLLILAWTWARVFDKKSIAWTVVIIVIKYAFLLGSIVILSRMRWFEPLWVAFGIASFLVSISLNAVSRSFAEWAR